VGLILRCGDSAARRWSDETRRASQLVDCLAERQRRTFAKCEYAPEKKRSLADRGSVDACTDMLPEKKPRYVMGIVWISSSLEHTFADHDRATPKTSSSPLL